MSATATASTTPPVEQNMADRSRKWRWLLHAIPNLVVFSLLGGLMYLGHQTGWKMSKVSELLGTVTMHDLDWCSEHLVPESQCIECRPELYPKHQPVGFCREHGVAECVIHHPELAQIQGEPRLPKYDTAGPIARMDRPANNSRNTLHTNRVQFTSAESVSRAGVDVDVVHERPMTDSISANGELVFDPTRVAHLSTRVPGTVAVVLKAIGDEVLPGEILALVDSAHVGRAKSDLLQAIVQVKLKTATVERLRRVTASGAVAGAALIEAEAARQEAEVALVSARQALGNLGFELPARSEDASEDARQVAEDLRLLGISTELAASLPGGTATANLIPVRAPYGGRVVAANVVAGEVVDPTNKLFTVADPRQLWLLLSVRQEDAKYVVPGLPVQFATDDGLAEVTGQVSWISPAVEERSRTVQVRVVVANLDGTLRDKTFGRGRIILREEPNALVVPRESLQSSNDAHFVFVRDKHYFNADAPKFFHVRQVRIGARDDQYVELLAGVLPGEVVATKGSPVLMGQLLRSAFGAGCGCHE